MAAHGRQRAGFAVADRLLDLGRGDVAGLQHDDRGLGVAGERLVQPGVGLRDLLAARDLLVDAEPLGLHAQRGRGQRQQEPGRQQGGDPGTGQDGLQQRPDHSGAPLAAPGEPDAAEVDLVAEQGQQRGQDGHRAEHRDAHDEDRRDREPLEEQEAGQEHPGHRDHDGDARDQHRAARGGGGDREGGLPVAAPAALLTFALQVEQAVVDADGEAHQQHDRVRRLVDVQRVADHREDTARGEERGEGEQDGQHGREQRAERDQQDAQRERHRRHLGPLEVAAEGLVEPGVGGGSAELPDLDGRVAPLRLRHRVLDRGQRIVR
ncbi:hypothetical protein SM418_10210 [Actinomadura chokoriensis]|uniref:Uncharacterized protein n=1 Tax=Actinomadura chokoriensis TaxID=454156 RepID=A0ABV4QUG0_9ACTN